MPPHHHRTVDRVVAVLEMTARHPRGLTPSEISRELDAPRSSVQGLTNGLVATGYLVEHGGRLTLGAGPFVLTLLGNRSAALRLTHDLLVEVHARLGTSVMAGIGVGDSLVYVDQVGDSPTLEFVARNHSRRSLVATAAGKIVLSELPAREMDGFLLAAQAPDRPGVERFLGELPQIRRTRLAYNRGTTIPDAHAVATPLHDADGVFVAALCTTVGAAQAEVLDELGERLRDAVADIRL